MVDKINILALLKCTFGMFQNNKLKPSGSFGKYLGSSFEKNLGGDSGGATAAPLVGHSLFWGGTLT